MKFSPITCLMYNDPEAYRKLCEKADLLNRGEGKLDPWSPPKKIKNDDLIAFLSLKGEGTVSEITAEVYGIAETNLAWPACKRIVTSRLESKNAKNHVHGFFERVEGKRGVWKLTAAKQAVLEKEAALVQVLDKKVEVPADAMK